MKPIDTSPASLREMAGRLEEERLQCLQRQRNTVASMLRALADEREAQAVPQGWVDAVRDAAFDEEGYTLNPDLAEVHGQMLAAAPKAPEADEVTRLKALNAELVAIAQLLALTPEEGGDIAQGTHYVRDGRIHCKGSFLALIERARAAIAKAEAQ